jgi:hypothetical protein
MRATPVIVALITGLSPAVVGCGLAPDAASKRRAGPNGLRVAPAPLHASPSKQRRWKRRGLLSGEGGGFTLYRRSDGGSADPTKPEKVRR